MVVMVLLCRIDVTVSCYHIVLCSKNKEKLTVKRGADPDPADVSRVSDILPGHE